jgi:biotin carboxyl carrier protein
MTFEIAVGDRIRAVNVARKGALLHVTVDGRTHVVDARRVSDASVSMLLQNAAGDLVRSVDVAVASRQNGSEFDVHLAGRSLAVEVRAAGSFGRQKKDGVGAQGTGPQRVLAPMPGKIVRVLVKAGDLVKARQGLVVVEAMKMENELRAARDGQVRDVPAVEGQSVDAGAVLVVVE